MKSQKNAINHSSRISNLFLLSRAKFTTRGFFHILVLNRTGRPLPLSKSLFLLHLLLVRSCHVIPHSVAVAGTMLALVVLPVHLAMLTDLPIIGVASTVQRVDAPQPFPRVTFAS